MSDYLSRREEMICALNNGSAAPKENVKNKQKDKYAPFVTFMDNYIVSHGLLRGFIFDQAYMNQQYGYKILNGKKHTYNRNMIIRICVAMKMSFDDVQTALKYYDMRLLDHTIFRDEVIQLGIEENKDVYGIDIWLRNAGLEPLIEDCT